MNLWNFGKLRKTDTSIYSSYESILNSKQSHYPENPQISETPYKINTQEYTTGSYITTNNTNIKATKTNFLKLDFNIVINKS